MKNERSTRKMKFDGKPPHELPEMKQRGAVLYASVTDLRHSVMHYLKDGVDHSEKVIVVLSASSETNLRKVIAKEGIVEPELSPKYLHFTNIGKLLKTREHDSDFSFLIEWIKGECRAAREEGFHALRIVIDMTKTVQKEDVRSDHIHLQAKLDKFISRRRCSMICLYDERSIAASLQIDIVKTHRSIWRQGHWMRSLYYISPTELSGDPEKRTEINHYLNAIAEQHRVDQVIRDKEAKYMAFFDLSPDGILTCDTKGFVLTCNPAFMRITGFKEHQIVGTHLSKLPTLVPEDIPQYVKLFGKMLRGRLRMPYEFRWKDKKGSIRLGTAHYSLLKDTGKVSGIQIVLTDITERKESEKELRESQERFRDLVESSSDWIWEVDANGVYTYVSPKIEEMLGFRPEEVIGKTPFDLMPQEESDRVGHLFRQYVSNGEPFAGLENINLHKDGRHLIFETSGVPIFDQEGKICGYRGVDRDITERKHAEDAVRESEFLLRQMANTIGDVFWITDWTNKKTVFASKSYEKIWGKSRESLYEDAKGWAEAIHPEDRERAWDNFYRLGEGETYDEEYRIIRPDGELRWIRDRGYPLHDDKEGVSRVVGLAQDITERKNAEAAFRESQSFNETILNTSPDIIYIYDLVDQKNVYSNEGVMNVLGYSVEEVQKMGNNLLKFLVHPDDFKKYSEIIIPRYLSARDGELIEHEYRMKHKNGDWRWLHSKESIFKRQDDGSPKQIFGIVGDITERKQSEEELRNTMQTSDDIVKTIPSGLFIYQFEPPDKLFLMSANPEAERLTGLKSEEWIGREFNEIWPEAKKQGVTDAFLSPMRTGKTYETEDLYYEDNRLQGAFRVRTFRLPSNRLAVAFENITDHKKAEQALQESEARYRQFISQVAEGVYRLEPDKPMPTSLSLEKQIDYLYDHFSVAECNESFIEMYGFKDKEDVLGMKLISFHGDRSNPINQTELRKFIESGYKVENELTEEVDADGHVKYFRNNTLGVVEDGKLIRIWGTQTDVTSQKETEKALQKTNANLMAIIENTDEFILISDHNAVPIMFNKPYAEVMKAALGIEMKPGIQPHKLLPDPAAVEWWDNMHRRVLKGERVHDEFQWEMTTGDLRYFEINYNPIMENGKVVGLTEFTRDITERKKTENSLQESEERYRTLVENSTNAIFLVQNGKVTYANHAGAVLAGYDKPDQLIGMNAVDMIHPDDLDQIKMRMMRIMKGERNPPSVMKILRSNGEIRYADSTSVPITLKGESGALVIGHDITERMLGEQQVAQSFEELKKSQLATINLMQDLSVENEERKRVEESLRKTLNEKDVLIKEVHHRVKNNLQIISSLLGLKGLKMEDETAVRAFEEMRSRILSMAMVHEQLYQSEDLADIEFAPYIESMVKSIQVANHMGPVIAVELKIPSIRLGIDTAIPCGLILNELITNAYKHAFKGKSKGRITIHGKSEQGLLELKVKDNGIGLPSDFKIEQSKSFGMNLVRILVDQIEGSFDYQKRNGSIFCINLRTDAK